MKHKPIRSRGSSEFMSKFDGGARRYASKTHGAIVGRTLVFVVCFLLGSVPIFSRAQETQLGSTMTLKELESPSRTPESYGSNGEGYGSAEFELAEDATVDPIEKRNFRVHEFVTASPTVPALKHRFWLPESKLNPGNASTHFLRAIVLLGDQPREFKQNLYDLLDAENPAPDELEKLLASADPILSEISKAASCEDLSYDLRLRDVDGFDFFKVLLPEIQQSRELARLLVLKFRLQMLKEDIDGAVATLQDGFRLAGFIGSGETLIQSLVGIAIQSIMIEELPALMNKGINVYWPLASLPADVISVRRAIELELSSVHRLLPALREAETQDYGEDYWNQAWADIVDSMSGLLQLEKTDSVGIAVLGVTASEAARRRLIEGGQEPEKVKSLPAMRAVLWDASLEIQRISDDLSKINLLPDTVPAALRDELADEVFAEIKAKEKNSGGAALASLLFPAYQAARNATIRGRYRIAQLMNVEAVRAFYASNGRYPESLDELRDTPAIVNPYDGRSFSYRVERTRAGGRIAIVSGTVPESARMFREFRFRLIAK